MEPIDVAESKFARILEEDLPQYEVTVITEADVRTKLIDRIFVEVLGWPYVDIYLEEQAGKGEEKGLKGFIDYKCTINGLNRLIIEAKRITRDLGIQNHRSGRFFKLGGSVFSSPHAREGIEQAIRYCGHKNSELACVTNGRQWIIFLGNRRGDGKETLDGMGCVFGSLDEVRSQFGKFYDLLSYEAVTGYRYRAEFQQAEGQPSRTSNFRASIRKPESRNLLPAGQLNRDLERVMISFFQDIRGVDDPEMRRLCFVTTNESQRAEAGLARISEELRNTIQTLHSTTGGEISDTIQRVKKMKRQEFVLLVGTKGAGKSTFIERFFEDILPKKIARDCVIIRIDVSASGADETSVIRWLDEHFLEATEKAVFGDHQPDFDDLKGMYFKDYERRRLGTLKPLYESDRTQFDIEFGKFVEQRREGNPHEYITHMLHRIVNSYIKIPCLVFDNADHFNIDFQEQVFQYAHSLYKEVLCLVLVPITDKTSWQLSRQGALQSFYTESYFLPTPAPDVILRKRVEFIERKISEESRPERGIGYFTSRGIELSIENLRAFTISVQSVFVNTGQVALWIGNLANHDIRRCLQLTREIVASPHIQFQELLKAGMTHTSIDIDVENIKLAIIRGKYDIYPASQNAFVQNLYALTTAIDTTPLLGLRILQLLEDTSFQHAEGGARYVEISHITEFFASMNVEPTVSLAWLDELLKTGLILSYDPTVSGVDKVFRVEISPSGQQHLLWAYSDWVYIESMIAVTPLLDRVIHQEISDLFNLAVAFARRKAIRTFILYILHEDSKYCSVPDHAQYAGQIRLMKRLEQQSVALTLPVRASGSARYGRAYGRVVKWDQDKPYGFIAPDGGGGQQALVHFRDIIHEGIETLAIGTLVEFDQIQGDKGLKALQVAVLT